MPEPIPLAQPDITQRDIDAVVDVLHTTTLSIGPKIEEFEAACATLAGRRHGIGVSSGTAGSALRDDGRGRGRRPRGHHHPLLLCRLRQLRLVCRRQAGLCRYRSARRSTWTWTRSLAAITPRTKAIVGVEIFGHPGGMPELEQVAQRHELVLIEDACEGFGGHVGPRPSDLSAGRASSPSTPTSKSPPAKEA